MTYPEEEPRDLRWVRLGLSICFILTGFNLIGNINQEKTINNVIQHQQDLINALKTPTLIEWGDVFKSDTNDFILELTDEEYKLYLDMVEDQEWSYEIKEVDE